MSIYRGYMSVDAVPFRGAMSVLGTIRHAARQSPATSRRDMKVRYVDQVSEERRVDRAVWAALVDGWVRNIAGNNQTRFANMIGVTPRTVSRWKRQQVDVSEENVRAAARVVGQKPMDLLVRVGYYAPEEAAVNSPAIAAPGSLSDEMDGLEFEISWTLRDETLSDSDRDALLSFMRDLQRRHVADLQSLERRQRDERQSTIQGVLDMIRRARATPQE